MRHKPGKAGDTSAMSIGTMFMRNEVFKRMWDKLALILLIIGGVNWGLVGIFEFDLVAWLF